MVRGLVLECLKLTIMCLLLVASVGLWVSVSHDRAGIAAFCSHVRYAQLEKAAVRGRNNYIGI